MPYVELDIKICLQVGLMSQC